MHPGHLWACASGRLGPLSVGLAAKSQSGKANFETCTRQLWELSKETLDFMPDNPGQNHPTLGSPKYLGRCKYPPPLLNRQSKEWHMLLPLPISSAPPSMPSSGRLLH